METIKLGARLCVAFAVLIVLLVIQAELREQEEAANACNMHRCT